MKALEETITFPVFDGEEVSYSTLTRGEFTALTSKGGLTKNATATLSVAARLLEGISSEEHRPLLKVIEHIHGGARPASITEKRALRALRKAGLVTTRGFTTATRYSRTETN